MADLKTQFGFTDSLFAAINEVKSSGTSLAGADAQIKRAKANLDAAELKARQEKERDKIRKKKESLRTEEAEEVEEESHQSKTTMKHISNPNAAEKKAAKDIKPGIKGVKDRLDMLKAAKDRGALKEEGLEESFSPSQIAALKKEYSTINGIDPSSDNYKKLIAMLDKLDLASLKSLAGAEIKFVSGLAKNRVMRKSVKEETKVEEELKGDQHKLDKNKNGKLDAEDFKKVRKEDVEIDEGAGNLKPGWMLKKDPELAKKVKEKQDLAKKRQASYGDKSAGKSVAEGIIDKIKAVKRGMDARAKAADHFDKAGDPSNPDKSKDLKRAVKYHNLVNKEEVEVEEEVKDEYARKVDKYLKNKYGSDDSKKKEPQGAEAAEKRRKERLASNGRMDEEVKVGDKVSFDHPMKAIPGKTMKKVGTVHKVEDDTVHIKVKDKYGVITHKKSASELTKEEFESIDEAPKYDNKYTIYHKDYSSAVQHAAVHAGKQGYEIDHDDWDRVVAMGPKKPSSGKTNILSVSLKKAGKETKKKLHMQVYNMDNKGYELNTYVEEVQLDELNKDTVYSYAKKSEKDQDDQEKKMTTAVKANDPKKANDAGRKFLNRLRGSERAEKRLNKEEATGYDEFTSGGKPLEKKFNKAFKAMGIKSDIKIKTVGNVSVNEAAKPTKKFKDMKKKNTAGTKSEEGTSKKGEPLSGKKEPIEVNPEMHSKQK